MNGGIMIALKLCAAYASPQIAILRDKKVLFMLERHQIQDRTADQIASELATAFDAYCVNGGR